MAANPGNERKTSQSERVGHVRESMSGRNIPARDRHTSADNLTLASLRVTGTLHGATQATRLSQISRQYSWMARGQPSRPSEHEARQTVPSSRMQGAFM